jgi:hypothetical protein
MQYFIYKEKKCISHTCEGWQIQYQGAGIGKGPLTASSDVRRQERDRLKGRKKGLLSFL